LDLQSKVLINLRQIHI